MKVIVFLLPAVLFVGLTQGSTLNVHVDQPGHKISPLLWGVFFEEINHAGDGGLYAELVKNRALSPKLPSPSLEGYSVVKSGAADGRIYVSRDHPLNDVLTSSLRLNVDTDLLPGDRIGVANEGYWGIPIRPDYTEYRASFHAKAIAPFTGPLTVSIESKDGSVIFASATVPAITDEFQKYEVLLRPPADLIAIPSSDNLFVVSVNGSVTANTSIFFNVMSLFPPTWNNRPNGLRIDLAQKLADMKPTFFRFPGGNFLEGNLIEERFIWEETIGDNSLRPGHMGVWGYYSTDGLGLMEYLELAEDLNAEIILCVYAGYSLFGDSVPPEEMGPYIESALNEIEYLIGNTSTTWGARRAADGHPTPFDLTYVEVGNEDWFSSDYEIRYPLFYDAITERYPELVIIATQEVKSRPVPVRDDHYYPGFGWFPDNHRMYDTTPRDGPQVFVGEYATRDNINPRPEANTAAAMDDAAFMTGLERNSDLVIMACYAPLFGHLNDLVWTPDGIYFDALQSFSTPAFWVQHMFGTMTGDTYIPTDSDANSSKIFHVASMNSETNTLILKVVNTNTEDIMIDTIQLMGVSSTNGGRISMLTGGRFEVNDINEPLRVSPGVETFNITANSFSFNAPAFSLTVFELQL